MTQFIALINSSVVFGTVILFGAVGEILTEKGGNLNLGVEGLMFMGGAFGLAGAFWYDRLAGDGAVGIAAVLIEDEATLKRVFFYPEKQKLMLVSDNPAWEPFLYVGEELGTVRILGLAVAAQTNLLK